MDEGLKKSMLVELTRLIRAGEECFLCTNTAQVACIPGPPDQLRLMQVIPDDQKGKVTAVGFPLCLECVGDGHAATMASLQGILAGKAKRRIREHPIAQVIPFRKREGQAV